MSDRMNEDMDLNEFCEYVETNIKDYLPESFQDWDIDVSETYKATGPKMAFTIKAPDENVAPVIYLDDFYTFYKEGRELPQLMNQISDLQVQHDVQKKDVIAFGRNNVPDIRKMVENWEYAKENIILDVAGCTKNAEMLAHRPHLKMGDIAAIYKIEIGRGENGRFSAPVTNEMKARYGVTTEELHDQALKNSESRYPVQVNDMGSVLEKMLGIDVPDMLENPMGVMGLGNSGLIVLSNQELFRGASVMFYPGVLDQVSAMCPDGFYMIPSSVHELLIYPKNNITDREMDEIIENVNAEIVAPDEQLSDFVHEYDPVSRILYAPALAQNYKLLEVNKDDVLKPETLGLTDDICNNSHSAVDADGLSQAVKTEQQRRMMKKRAGR
ncbi:MAG: DUF5688 family protein [Lachnospiraceae bacterium]|nr:DUF5688 family protein [Lachnospiraceae bacterium]